MKKVILKNSSRLTNKELAANKRNGNTTYALLCEVAVTRNVAVPGAKTLGGGVQAVPKPGTQINKGMTKSVGPNTTMSVGAHETGASQMVLSFDNSDGVTNKTYLIGDGYGMIRKAITDSGGTAPSTFDDTGSSLTDANLKAMIASNPITIKGIVYSTSSTAAQFGQPVKMAASDMNGKLTTDPIFVGFAQNNYQQNPLLQTLEFPEGGAPLLDGYHGVLVTVLAGEAIIWYVTTGFRINVVNS